MTEQSIIDIRQEDKTIQVVKRAITRCEQMWPDRLPGKGRFAAIATSLALHSPALAKCSIASKLVCLNQVAQIGLIPDPVLGHCYILPFHNKRKGCDEAKLIMGYKGLVELARRSASIDAIETEVIYDNDEMSLQRGTSPLLAHRYWWQTGAEEPGNLLACYALCWLKGSNRPMLEVMHRNEVERVRASSRSAKHAGSPWVEWPDTMWRKTVLKRASKTWPLTAEYAQAIAIDDATETGSEHVHDAGCEVEAGWEEADPANADLSLGAEAPVREVDEAGA